VSVRDNSKGGNVRTMTELRSQSTNKRRYHESIGRATELEWNPKEIV
jgi:hypothetical protein